MYKYVTCDNSWVGWVSLLLVCSLGRDYTVIYYFVFDVMIFHHIFFFLKFLFYINILIVHRPK